jgi:protein-disulfide isomerase
MIPARLVLLLAAGIACASGERDGVKVAEAGPAASAEAQSEDPRIAKADSARILGDAGATTWLVVISDFQCPYCKQWHDSSGEALRTEYVNTGKVRLAYINFPLGQHQQAVPTAEAAMCAGVQGRFWPYHDALFATQQRWAAMPDATTLLDSLARALSLDVAAHKQCRESHVLLPLIEADRQRATATGARSTPTLIVGGRIVEGAVPMLALRRMLDAAIPAR